MKIETKNFDTVFNNTGANSNVNKMFSCINVYLNRFQSIEGYFVSEKQTNIFCVKGMICLVAFSLDDSEIKEFFIGDENKMLVSIQPNIAFAWKNISCCESIVISDLNHIKMTIDIFDEDKQSSILGYSIPYRF